MSLPQEKKQEVVDYIAAARGEGRKDKEIRKALLDSGWTEQQIAPFFPDENKHKLPVSSITLLLIMLAIVSFSITGFLVYYALR